jgi:hypothetical protein
MRLQSRDHLVAGHEDYLSSIVVTLLRFSSDCPIHH